MRIQIQQSIAGLADPRYGLDDFSFAPGQEVDVHEDLAAAWVESGVAVAVKPPARARASARQE